jgi:2,3-bisphosphoglycerate-dependent phosphoglycerate mutase
MTAPDATAVVPQPRFEVDRATTTELLLIRHGRSADVRPGSAESADPGLHPDGVAQVTALAERLATKKIDAIYSSHLRRARLTAAALAEPRALTVGVDVDLEEVRLGDWANGEFRRRAAAKDPTFEAWRRTGRWDGIPGGEGDDAFRARVRRVVDEIAARHVGQTVAVVCHGGVIGVALASLLDIHRSLWMTCENTSITTVRSAPDGAMVVGINDCAHLYDPVVATV